MIRQIWVDKEDNNNPIFWDKAYNNIRIGSRNNVTTVEITTKVPKIKSDYHLFGINQRGDRVNIEGESHSWTRNYYNWLCSAMGINANDATNFQDGNINGKDTGGTVRKGTAGLIQEAHRNISFEGYSGYSIGYWGLVANSNAGIIVGIGDTVESFNDYILASKVAHGTGANQLYYQTSPTPAPITWNSVTRTLSYKLTRWFDNFSGGSITLKEIGQIGVLHIGNSVALRYSFLVARDLISDLIIANKSSAMISYIYSMVYPSVGSPLRTFYNYMFCQFASVNADNSIFGDGYLNSKNTSGTVIYSDGMLGFDQDWSLSLDGGGYFKNTPSGSAGGVIGIGDTAVSFEDYTLANIIVHGTGAGQMSYGTTEVPLKSWSSPIMTIQQAKTISNNSGGDITVKEVGLIGQFYVRNSGSNSLVLRDVISDVVVTDGSSIRPVHKFEITFP